MSAPSDPRDLQLSSYDYPLPPERIAQSPVEPRHSARLLMVTPSGREVSAARHGVVWDLLEQLHPGDLLVVNDTRVLKARLRVRRAGGGLSERLVLEPSGYGAVSDALRRPPGCSGCSGTTGHTSGENHPACGPWHLPACGHGGSHRAGAPQ